MTDIEKLIELLKSSRDVWVADSSAKILADHLIANGVTVQQWIPVAERLPDRKGNYLGFTGSTTMVGYYKGNGIWWISYSFKGWYGNTISFQEVFLTCW